MGALLCQFGTNLRTTKMLIVTPNADCSMVANHSIQCCVPSRHMGHMSCCKPLKMVPYPYCVLSKPNIKSRIKIRHKISCPTCCRVSAMRGWEVGPSTSPLASLDPKVLTDSAGSVNLELDTLGLRAAPSGASARRVHCCSGGALPECHDLPTVLRPARLGKSLSKGGCAHTHRRCQCHH